MLGGQLKQGKSYIVASSAKLHNYTRETIRVVGSIIVEVTY